MPQIVRPPSVWHAPATAMRDEAPGDADNSIWIDTDHYGLILDCSEPALVLIGHSMKSARGRSLLLMFVGDRPGAYQFGRAMSGHAVSGGVSIRPHDQPAVHVRYRIARAGRSSEERPILRWTLEQP